jgi:hypothetical protein
MESVKMYLVKADRTANEELDLRKSPLSTLNIYAVYREVNEEITHYQTLYNFQGYESFRGFITNNLSMMDSSLLINPSLFRNFSNDIIKKEKWDKFKKICKKHFTIVDITGIDLSQHLNTLSTLTEELKNNIKEKDELLSTFKTIPFTTKSGKYKKIDYKNKLFLPYDGGAYLSDDRTYLIAVKGKGYGDRFEKLTESIKYYRIYDIMEPKRDVYYTRDKGKILNLGKKGVPKVMDAFLKIEESMDTIKKKSIEILKNLLSN